MLTRDDVNEWMKRLQKAWTTKDVEGALALFKKTEHYYERPFHAGTTQAEFRKYWQDIVSLQNITLEYDIVAVDGQTACVHWVNKFSSEGKMCHLDGMFLMKFDKSLNCVEFRQWWFMAQ
jgi:hypothetical protein